VAFPELPTLPQLPDIIDPDRWLKSLDGQCFIRRVNASGGVKLDKHYYYVRRNLKGRSVVLQIAAEERSLKVLYRNEEIKTIPLKGLYGQPMSFEAYLELIRQEAVSEWRAYLQQHRRYLPVVV
jgi:hypothetical protein